MRKGRVHRQLEEEEEDPRTEEGEEEQEERGQEGEEEGEPGGGNKGEGTQLARTPGREATRARAVVHAAISR